MKLKIYCRKEIYPALNSIMKKHYPNLEIINKGYSKKFEDCNEVAFSKIKECSIYYYGKIDEYVLLHELNHILLNEDQKISDEKFNKIIKILRKKVKKSKIPRMLYPLYINEEFLVDCEVFKKAPSLFESILKMFIAQAKTNQGIDLYCDFLSLSYLNKIQKTSWGLSATHKIEKKLPDIAVSLSDNFIHATDIYNTYLELLKLTDAGKISCM